MNVQTQINSQAKDFLLQFPLNGLEPIILISRYKGTLLAQPVEIHCLDKDKTRLRILHHPDWISQGDEVYLNHIDFIRPIKAKITNIDWRTCILTLDRMAFVDHDWNQRRNERVEPGDLSQIRICKGKITAPACLVNISIDGAGILASYRMQKALSLEPGTALTLIMVLPGLPTPLSVKGIVARTTTTSMPTLQAIGISFHLPPGQEKLLKGFIEQQHAFNLAELRAHLKRLFEPVETKDLYF
jgi:hypothetical protein